ncbi:hypothetical protein C4D60_Mb00t07240 [Musa balbisiana]|uniref:Glycine cleavage system H protein n=1 Tax=Musa balbisiana TaxID=52838 RepID=A0A4V6T3X2_MUSBA|nr:hypothetical protein C4D60_Mb00t07240 [Musa balbisiana]
MALKLWASSTANALRISCSSSRPAFPAFSIFRSFSSGKKLLPPAVSALHSTEKCSSRMWDTSPFSWREFAETECILCQLVLSESSLRTSIVKTVIEGLKYTGSHEWVKREGSVATVGITDHAQSVKATSDVNSPVSGEVIEVNTRLTETPGLINSSPYEDGWMIKVRPSDPSEEKSLMGSKEYTKFCEEEDAH